MIWCEHCRDHYPDDHYLDGSHKVGEQYGPTGVLLGHDRDREKLIHALRLIHDWDMMSAEARSLERVDAIIEKVFQEIGEEL